MVKSPISVFWERFVFGSCILDEVFMCFLGLRLNELELVNKLRFHRCAGLKTTFRIKLGIDCPACDFCWFSDKNLTKYTSGFPIFQTSRASTFGGAGIER